MKLSMALLLLCMTLALAQISQPKKPATPAPPEPFSVRVYGAPWEPGELRSCSTYWHHSDFLLCDDETRDKILDITGRGGTAARIFTNIQTAPPSKKFLVQFSKLPWRLAPPNPDKNSDIPLATYPVPDAEQGPIFADPDPGSTNMESRWDCTKEKTITCKFLRSF